MSTTLSPHASSSLETSDTEECYSHEAEQAIMRAQQRARAFVSQTAPQSPVSSLPHSPLESPSKSRDTAGTTASPESIWSTPLAPNKSQEAVKSSLKVRPRLQRANSEPAQKSVHFSTTNLVDVRQFKRTQRPSAVSKDLKSRTQHTFYLESGDAGTYMSDSAADEEGDEDEYDDSYDDSCDDEEDFENYADDDVDEEDDQEDDERIVSGVGRRRSTKLRLYKLNHPSANNDEIAKGWTLLTPGFVPFAHGHVPGQQRPICYLETLQLSPSQGNLKASVYVRNVSYDKYVVLRYTVNNWASYSETQGVWTSDIRKFDRDAGYDRFDVTIPLNQFPSYQLNQSSMELCIRYVAGDKGEFWDNNGGKNYEIFLRNSKLGSQNTVPRTNDSTASSHKQDKSKLKLVPQSRNAKKLTQAQSEFFYTPTDITLRSENDVKQRDPFIGRYSFESSYYATPKSRKPSEYTNAPVFTISGGHVIPSSPLPQDTNLVPVELKAARELYPISGKPTRIFDSSDSNGVLGNGWDSKSYNDFVSKYCFYTPTKSPVNTAAANAKQHEVEQQPSAE